ncbi:hypothetical protein [Klebsiella variicola]|uniref:hypothetical protein n=1 Tax=Klebsiella variicola TaxID=244366 RepID=UPI002B054DC3|nr:hypothetical protein [Klebsiella variicola]
MTDKTGGPAFPLPPSEHMYADAGMTLRDYFAAKAMQGLLSNDQCKPFGMSASATDIAKKSYLMADEMLRARER